MTLDYRFPDTGPPRAQQVATALAAEEAFDWIAMGLKLIFGIPLCFLPPMALAFFFMIKSPLPWSYFQRAFLWTSIVFLPLAFWIEWWRKKELNWHAAAKAVWISPIDFITVPLLLGPKLILSLVNQCVSLDEPNLEIRAMAAEIVIELLDAGYSMPIRRLLLDGRRDIDEVSQAMKYLERREWIKIPRTRDRVWLNDSIRKELAHLQ